ncbi:substrate-binding protein [Methylobacterium sp.]|uniref:substrate-binding protein n=1 Tax=Methylobacterium sp. TaxID=409 RepID=UPI003B015636
MSRIVSLPAGVFAFGLLASSALAAGDTITIGIPVGLSGANSVVAPSVVQASELAVEEINAKGGILGKKVVLEVADDASGAAGAQKAYDLLIFKKKVDAIVAMETSAARNAGLPIVNRGKIPYIYTSFYEGRSCNPYMYINAWVPEQQVAPIVDYFNKQGAKTFFLIGSDYSFGRGMLAFTKAYIEKNGGKVVGDEYAPMDATDWTAVLAKVKSANPDAIITSTAGGAPNVTLTKQLRAAGIKAFYGNLAVDEGTARSMGADAEGIYIAGSYFTNIDTPANKNFLAAVEKKFGNDLKTPNELSVPQYEAIFAYKAAVEKAGTTDAAKVVPALAEVSVEGPRGTIAMSKQRHAPLTMYLGQVKTDGSVSIISTFKDVDPGEQCPKLK